MRNGESILVPDGLSDAEIVGFQYKGGELEVEIRNWKERRVCLVFREVSAIREFCSGGRALDALLSYDDSVLLEEVRQQMNRSDCSAREETASLAPSGKLKDGSRVPSGFNKAMRSTVAPL